MKRKFSLVWILVFAIAFQSPLGAFPFGFWKATGGGPPATPALIAHTGITGTPSGTTTVPIDTTGANFMAVGVATFPGGTGGTLTDSKGNTWTPLTQPTSAGLNAVQIFYCYGGTVGTLHTFTYTGVNVYSAVTVQAWSNMASSPFDVQNSFGLSSSSSTIQPGSVTPSQANSVIITALGNENNSAGTISIDSGFTISDSIAFNPGTAEGCSLAYKILTASAANNPTWNLTNTAGAATSSIAVFKY